jgi:ribosomal protein S18 acetylase RimI-like enzyme
MSRQERYGAEKIQVREAGPEDAADIARVLYESFIEFRALYTDDGFTATTPTTEQILIRMAEGPVWVASRDAVVLGTVAAVVKGHRLYMRGMAVLSAVRGLGVGVQLLDQVERRSRAEGCRSVFLSTTPFLSGAIRLYERAGFQRTDEGPCELFGTPLFTMEKDVVGGHEQ